MPKNYKSNKKNVPKKSKNSKKKRLALLGAAM
jgi:hypothetical protein